MTGASRRLVSLAALTALFAAGCDRERPVAPQPGAVAAVGGHPISAAEFERYVASILNFEDEDEPLEGEDLDRVRSRLFDAFIEEEILLFEAERRGVTIDEDEIDTYLGVGRGDAENTAGSEEDARATARRNLMIQKLRGAVVSVDAGVTDAEVDAYIEDNRAELEADQHVVLRSLTVGTETNAAKVREEIRTGKVAFSEATAVFATTHDQGQPMEVSLNDLPPEIRGAVAGLESGEVSKPVEFQGTIYLFLVDVGPAKVPEPRLREKARAELIRTKSQQASDGFLERLRSEIAVEIHHESLPFTYLPE